LDPELNKVVENYTQRSGPLKGRSLYILKRENPTDESSTHTRSGRASIRPLAYWRNERCVYGDGEAEDGQRFPLSTIKEIVRAEELEPERTKKGKRAGRKSKSKKQAESSDEEDEHLDVWEKESGVLHGFIPRWDPKSQTSTKEEDVIG
jgi:centromere protein C